MAIDSVQKAKQRERATELLGQGCTTQQIAARTGLTTRAVLRLKQKLKSTDGEGTSR